MPKETAIIHDIYGVHWHHDFWKNKNVSPNNTPAQKETVPMYSLQPVRWSFTI